jgi:hypothetical protein
MQKLNFHTKTRRWRAYEGTRLICPIHCGDPALIEIGDAFFTAHMELDKKWYVKFGEARFWLHRKAKYRAMLLF